MQTISKKISLEPLITRFPVCYPSIVDGNVTYYTSDNSDYFNNAFYGRIPLGVNESITNTYNTFTDEMYEAYSGKTIHCYTLQKWFNEFKSYYSTLRSSECRGIPFSSMTQYYETVYKYGYNQSEATRIDDEIKLHGGKNFYKWLLDNYFITLDLLGEYESINNACTYYEWQSYVDNIGLNYMAYPDALKLCGKMKTWDSLYYNHECSEFETCCDCVDYKNYGGHVMCQFLISWINRINENINIINGKIYSSIDIDELIPKTDINFKINTKIEDLGSYVNFCKEFEPGRRYKNGEVCSYSGDVYIYNGLTDYISSIFDENEGWERYYTTLSGDCQYEEDLVGRTASNLESLMRKDLSYDVMGNKLPGYYEPNNNSNFIQPPENTVLEFMYKPGTYTNIEKWKLDELTQEQIYICDYLESIEFYYKDINGEKIEETSSIAEQGDSVNERLFETESYINGGENKAIINNSEVKYEKFIRYDSGLPDNSPSYSYYVFDVEGYDSIEFLGLQIYSGGTESGITRLDSGFCFVDENDNVLAVSGWSYTTRASQDTTVTTKRYNLDIPSGATHFKTEVRYTRHSSNINIDFGPDFYLYKYKDVSIPDGVYIDDGTMYADFHYSMNVPVKIDDNGIIIPIYDEGGYMKCIDHCTIEKKVCQYSLSDTNSYPLNYYDVNLDVENQYSEELGEYIDVAMADFIFLMTDFDKTYVASPLLREEELLPFSYIERPVDNIYINRGYATALDRHLRICETNNCEQVEDYGNGIFQIFNVNE